MVNDRDCTERAAVNRSRLERIVIVGAGQAGVELAVSLRQHGFVGSIILVGEERDLPYQRPPLSKDLHPASRAAMLLRAQGFYAANSIELRLGAFAECIDRNARVVVLADGTRLAYDHLVLAMGSRNRGAVIPGLGTGALLELRTLAHARKLAARVGELRHVTIVGGGFIGLELASLFRSRGIEIDVIEASERPMGRALSPMTSEYFRRFHTEAGVRFRLRNVVQSVGYDVARQVVTLSDGTTINTDAIIMATGVLPNDALAATAGLKVSNGVVVDAQLRTSDPTISAIGDCAAHPNPFCNGLVRLESVQNAIDQARYVAARLIGSAAPYRSLPWFWSNQGSARLQIAGFAADADNAVLRGKPESGAFSVFLYRGERLIAVESVNKPSDHVAARRILSGGLSVPKSMAAETSADLKQFAGAAVLREVSTVAQPRA
ncbi:FAD-dependent oxidoreductase [Bradyrhizobium yuanmingense]|uniref:NAD(P)/FAD-dependent oxidoreductase n=1 Tax=Bradyrhizobium yuanmingense TaxID=108015 RepID=UPI0023B9456D|nr:FAD-dependent oxidoreductase [Bradyrhizobium yuanmingense]MDF0523330.1 FAD-dependent oxidoreductase [Bradyrhizobium yuanmingense]